MTWVSRVRNELEVRGTERTADLIRANDDLKLEIAARKRADEERERLLVREQTTLGEAMAAQQQFRDLVNSVEGVVWEADVPSFQFLFISKKAERILGYPVECWLSEPTFWKDHLHPEDRAWALQFCQNATAEKRDHDFEYRMIAADGSVVWLHDLVSVVLEGDRATRLRGVMVDITERKRAEVLLAGEKRLLEMIARGDSRALILEGICRFVEELARGSLSSILLLDANGNCLRHGAAPNLPLTYTEAINGAVIGPSVGSCGAAAYRAEPVIVSDIATDPLWADYRNLALAHGLRACWSTPILSSAGKVLGTFATYYREPRSPSPQELNVIDRITHLASIAVERDQAEEELRGLSGQLLRSQDEERRRIARDLHDSTGQDLVGLATMLGQLRDSIPSGQRKSRRVLSECKALAQKCIRDVRTLSYVLHPPLLDHAGLGYAIRDYVDGFTKRSGIQVDLELSPTLGRLPRDMELALFRVAQESLTNIQRHSGSQRAKIRIHRNSDLTLEISDLGRGVSASVARGKEESRFKIGVGISSMQERVKVMRGRLDVDSTSHGTIVRVTIPLGNAREKTLHSDS
jgi:PAS domain S-box-containing protein